MYGATRMAAIHPPRMIALALSSWIAGSGLAILRGETVVVVVAGDIFSDASSLHSLLQVTNV